MKSLVLAAVTLPFVIAETQFQRLGGDVAGNFEFLGALCFPESKGVNTRVTVEITVAEEYPPDDLAILFYDDQPAPIKGSFDMITRAQDGSAPSCQEKAAVSKQFTKCDPRQECQHGLPVHEFRDIDIIDNSDPMCKRAKAVNDTSPCVKYSQQIAVKESHKRIWYFAASQCKSGAVNIVNFNINSEQAIDCELVRIMYQEDASPANTTGWTIGIIILMAGCIVTYVFLVRCFYAGSDLTDPSELNTEDDDDDNEILDKDNADYNSL